MYRYTVNEDNTVEVFVEGQEAPILRQPHYPNDDSFDTKAEAEEWAGLFIAAIEVEDAPYAPNGKGLVGEPKPTKEQILEHLREEANSYGENVPQELADRIALIEAELEVPTE
jgi:hypothetical protein